MIPKILFMSFPRVLSVFPGETRTKVQWTSSACVDGSPSGNSLRAIFNWRTRAFGHFFEFSLRTGDNNKHHIQFINWASNKLQMVLHTAFYVNSSPGEIKTLNKIISIIQKKKFYLHCRLCVKFSDLWAKLLHVPVNKIWYFCGRLSNTSDKLWTLWTWKNAASSRESSSSQRSL